MDNVISETDSQFWKRFKPELRVINAKLPRPMICRGSRERYVVYAIAKHPVSKDQAKVVVCHYADFVVRFTLLVADRAKAEISVAADEAEHFAPWFFDMAYRRLSGQKATEPPVALDVPWTTATRYAWSIGGHEALEEFGDFSPWRQEALDARLASGMTYDEARADMHTLRFNVAN